MLVKTDRSALEEDRYAMGRGIAPEVMTKITAAKKKMKMSPSQQSLSCARVTSSTVRLVKWESVFTRSSGVTVITTVTEEQMNRTVLES